MSKHISEFNDSPSENIALADSVLEAADDMCQELGLMLFLVKGTALGLVRDRAYVEDNDLDVAVVSSKVEYQDLWDKLAALPGWSYGAGLRKDRIQLDLNYTDKDLPYYVVPSWRPNLYVFHEFDVVSYHGRNYNVPAPIEDYLEWEFSKLWATAMSRATWVVMNTWLKRQLLGEDWEEILGEMEWDGGFRSLPEEDE